MANVQTIGVPKLPIVIFVIFHVIDVPTPYVTTYPSVMNIMIFSNVGTLRETEKKAATFIIDFQHLKRMN